MIHALIIILLSFLINSLPAQTPAITVVCVVDQLSEHVLSRHRHLLTGGIRRLLDEGTYFSHAYHPHSQPETATGHAMIATGTYAHKHGLVANEWYLPNGKKINACDELDLEYGHVFALTDKTGKSARSLMAPTLADSCRKSPYKHNVIAVSLKSRAAIPLAGHFGLPIWFDTKGGIFTSSTAFCSMLPPWVTAMNQYLAKTLHTQEKSSWTPQFSDGSEKYQYVDPNTYTFAGNAFSLIREPQPFTKPDGSRYYHLFEQMPDSSLAIMRLGLLAAHTHKRMYRKKPLLLYISLSNFDYAGHYYGPYSKEVIDILFAIDHQLEHFMNSIEKMYGAKNCLWALTADHGVTQIPELLHHEGNPKSQRLDANQILKDLNHVIYKLFDVKNIFKATLPPHFYLDQDKWSTFGDTTKDEIIFTTKSHLQSIKGIKHAWHQRDLISPAFAMQYPPQDRAHWFAAQYMAGRSGDFVVQVEPFSQISIYPKGTSHDTPYDQDIRVPLIFAGRHIGHNEFDHQVSMRHFSSTLAKLLDVPVPAEAPAESLLEEAMHQKYPLKLTNPMGHVKMSS